VRWPAIYAVHTVVASVGIQQTPRSYGTGLLYRLRDYGAAGDCESADEPAVAPVGSSIVAQHPDSQWSLEGPQSCDCAGSHQRKAIWPNTPSWNGRSSTFRLLLSPTFSSLSFTNTDEGLSVAREECRENLSDEQNRALDSVRRQVPNISAGHNSVTDHLQGIPVV
jgi:hypothetical protein